MFSPRNRRGVGLRPGPRSGAALPQAYPLPEVRYDSVEYLSLARNLADGKGFTEDGVSPAVYRPPLFSALLGGWFFLTGTSSPFSAALLQSFFHAAWTAFAFLLFLEITPSLAWATCAALFLAVNPLLVTSVDFVLKEPTLLLFTTIAAWLLVWLVKAPSMPRAVPAGAACGLCTLAKVVAGFAPFLRLAMRFLPGRLRREWRGGAEDGDPVRAIPVRGHPRGTASGGGFWGWILI